MHDKYVREIIDSNINMLVPWWLISAYAYEKLSDPVISDELFDEIAIRLEKNWNKIEHIHKDLLDNSFLKSAIAFKGKEWPSRVISNANYFAFNRTEFYVYPSKKASIPNDLSVLWS